MPIAGCGEASYDALQIGADPPLPFGLYRRAQVPVLAKRGNDAGLERSGDGGQHLRLQHRVRHATRPTSRTRSTARSSTSCPGEGLWAGGWRVGGIVNARSGVPINVTINRPDTLTLNGVTVTNVPGGNTRGTQRPDLVPGVDPYLKDGVRWLNPGGVCGAAAGHVR